MALAKNGTETIPSTTETGSGKVHDKEMAILKEIVACVNDLFEGVMDGDQVAFVSHVLKDKLMESEDLAEQARHNIKAQFANSPTLMDEMVNAIVASMEAHKTIGEQALSSAKIRKGLVDILLGPAVLYDSLRSL
jgi:type I restriction enzyme R subunit